MENNLYSTKDGSKVYITYFDALYLLNIVFKENNFIKKKLNKISNEH